MRIWLLLLISVCSRGEDLFEGRTGCAILLDARSGRLLEVRNPEVAAKTLARPGSTMKPFAIAALLEKGAIAPATAIVCGRKVRLLGRELDCSHDRLAGPLHPAEAIAFSCNFFVTQFASRLTGSDLARTLRSAGLASRTELVPNEAVGEVSETASVAARQLQAIGESGILVTPLGLAVAYRHLAAQARSATLQPVFQGLREAVSAGTAQLAASRTIAISGKTGTALSVDGSHRQAWFAGFAPSDSPEIVVVVFVSQGSGARDAAPIAKRLIEAWAARR